MKKIIFLFFLKLLICNLYINNTKIYKNNNFTEKALYGNLNQDNLNLKKKNLILSIIVRYSWNIILPFIKSFIKLNINNCDIVIFISEVSHKVKNNLKNLGVIIFEIKKKLKHPTDIFRERWKLYSDFLNENKYNYNLVLCIDIRDTIIQKEFFSIFSNYTNFLGFSYESSTNNKLIGKYYIIKTFGIEKYKSIINKRTINAGIVWGTIDYLINFSNIVYKKLLIYFIYDQTIINYLIYYENILNNWNVIYSDEYGQVITLGLTEHNKIYLDLDNNILNRKGEIVSIVHQYDRVAGLNIIIKNKLCPELKHKVRTLDIYNLLFMHELLIIILFFKMMFYIYNIKSKLNKINK